MARLGSKRTRDPRIVGSELRAFAERKGLTQAQFARAASVHQPQVSRVLNGDFSRRSKAAAKMCRFAQVLMTEPDDDGRGEFTGLVELLKSIWDGTPADAKRVSALLKAAADLRRP